MENKPKPSLFLTGNHLKIDEPGIPFTEDMLTWPIVSFMDYPELCKNVERNAILRNVLSALMQLQPFQVKISITAEVAEQRLCYENRTWCKIFLREESVITFSHSTKQENTLFSNIEEWVEEQDTQQDMLANLAKWSVDNWITFFKKKITTRALHLNGKAKKKRGDAQKLEDSAIAILASLGTGTEILITQPKTD